MTKTEMMGFQDHEQGLGWVSGTGVIMLSEVRQFKMTHTEYFVLVYRVCILKH